MNPTLKAPETKCLKLEYHKMLSNFTFNFTLRRYMPVFVPNEHTHVVSTLRSAGACRPYAADVQQVLSRYPPAGRDLHSSTSQLNSRRVCHKKTS